MIRVDDEISLHPVTLSDADAMYALVDANREHLGRWLPWVESLRSVGDERRWLRQRAGMDASSDEEAWLIRYNGETVGAIGLIYDAPNNGAEVGYWLTEAAQGHGIVTRSCSTLLGYAFMVRSVHRLQLRAASENVRSVAVAERLGFTFEGVQREALSTAKGYQDAKVYSMLVSEWEQRTD
jgi:ribosomal-protein-serine acetyltransferase